MNDAVLVSLIGGGVAIVTGTIALIGNRQQKRLDLAAQAETAEQKRFSDLENRLQTAWTAQNDNLRAIIAGLEARVTAQQAQIDGLTRDLQASREHSLELERERDRATLTLEARTVERDQALSRLAQANAVIVEMESRLASMQLKEAMLETRIEDLERDLDEHRRRCRGREEREEREEIPAA